MHRLRFVLLPTLAICVGLIRPATASESAQATLTLEDCRITDVSGLRTTGARCGWLARPENPEQPDGTQIKLYVAVIPALSSEPARDAIFAIAGGPGGASTEAFGQFTAAFSRAMPTRDLVLVDQRGTGRSHPLECPTDEVDASTELDAEAMREFAKQCAQALEADLRYFTTSVAVQDIEAVRQALDYESLNIYGVSYGTRVALHYLRRYPQSVRTLIIDGVVPAQVPLGPEIALDAQQALDNLFARCASQPDCDKRFPELAAKFEQLRERVEQTDVTLTLPDPTTGQARELIMNTAQLSMAIRLLSYSPYTMSLIPMLIDEAVTHDNLHPLAAQAIMTGEQLGEMLSYGMHNSVMCAEDIPFYGELTDRGALADTYLGVMQVDVLAAVCESWPRGVMDEDFKQPVRSDKPVLLLSGAADPVTPPRNAQRAIGTQHEEPYLSNALHVVADGQGHGIATVGCMPKLLGEFIETASLDALDVSCMDRVGATPFFESFVGPAP